MSASFGIYALSVLSSHYGGSLTCSVLIRTVPVLHGLTCRFVAKEEILSEEGTPIGSMNNYLMRLVDLEFGIRFDFFLVSRSLVCLLFPLYCCYVAHTYE